MLTLLITTIASFVTAHFGEVLGIFKDGKDKKHELEIMKLQIAQQEKGGEQRLEEIRLQAYATERVAIEGTYKSAIDGAAKWVKTYNAITRPNFAHALLFIYLFHKIAINIYFLVTNAPVFLIWDNLFTEFDAALLGSIVGFYFGGRAIEKRKGA